MKATPLAYVCGWEVCLVGILGRFTVGPDRAGGYPVMPDVIRHPAGGGSGFLLAQE